MPSAWMTEPGGPYRLVYPNGETRVCFTRIALWQVLDAMSLDERCDVRVRVDWHDDDGEYVHAAMRREVNHGDD